MAALLSCLVSTQTANAEYMKVPGSSCIAANLHQAEQLSWNHFRVYNPFSPLWIIGNPPPPSYFTICSVPFSSTRESNGDDLAIAVWFGSVLAASVPCTARYIDPDNGPQNSHEIITAKAGTVSHPAAPIGANGASRYLHLDNIITQSADFDNYLTVTCDLKASTGINMLTLDLH